MKCNSIPRLWIIFFLKIAKNRGFFYKFCYRPFNDFHRHCRKWYLYNLFKNNSVKAIDYDDPNIFDILQ